jgi:phosphoserine phosphatase
MSTVVVDLDGTLVRVNTFPMWIKSLFGRSLRSLRLLTFLRLLWYVVSRKILGTTSHETFKSQVDRLPVPSSWITEFTQSLQSCMRPDVVAAIAALHPSRIVLATAAPSVYAKEMPNISPLPFDEVLCSHQEGANYVNNSRGRKRDGVLKYLNARVAGESEFVLFTDHCDDLELARIAAEIYLCHPGAADLECFRAAGLRFHLIA